MTAINEFQILRTTIDSLTPVLCDLTSFVMAWEREAEL